MLRKHRFRLAWPAIALALLLWLAGATAPARAAPLTGGNTIYLIDGRESTFAFDPITRKDGQLIPEEVFRTLGFAIAVKDSEITVSRNGLSAVLALGSSHVLVGAEPMTISPGPVALNERLFLPLSLLPEFGFEVSSDNGFLQIRDLSLGLPEVQPLDKAAWEARWERQTVRGLIRSDDRSVYVNAEVTWLTADLVSSARFPVTYRQRVEYLDLLKRSSLLLVKVTNQTGRSASVSPASLMLVDQTGTQYDVVQTLAHRGLISQKIAAGAIKSSVLVYPGMPAGTTSLAVFAATNDGTLGTLSL